MNAQYGLHFSCAHATNSGFLATCPPIMSTRLHIVIKFTVFNLKKKLEIKKMYGYIHDILILLCLFTSS